MHNASPLVWHDETQLLGVHVRAHFFDADSVAARAGFVERSLPVFTGNVPLLIGSEDQRPIYTVAEIWAQPDAVFEHGEGLLCLSHRQTAKLSIDRSGWKGQLRADTILQAIAVAMVVAGARQLPTAALLRLRDALMLLAPSPAVLECMATSVDAARRYWSAPRAVSAVQLARYCEPVLRTLPGVCTPAREAPAAEHID